MNRSCTEVGSVIPAVIAGTEPFNSLHQNPREEEWLYVLEGQITAEIGEQRIILDAGGSAFVSRGTVHTFQNFGEATARMLVMVTPGGFNRFFEELSSLNKGLPPDLARTEQLMNDYGHRVAATRRTLGRRRAMC